MLGAGETVGVVLAGGLLLADDPVGMVLAALDGILRRSAGGGVVFLDKTIVHGADTGLFVLKGGVGLVVEDQGLVGVGELGLTGSDGVDELFLEVAGEEDVRHDGLHDVAADVGHFLVALQHAAVLGDRVGEAVDREALDRGLGGLGGLGSLVGRTGGLGSAGSLLRGLRLELLLERSVGLERGVDELKAQGLTVGRADDILIGDADHLAAGGDGVEVRTLLREGIVGAVVGKGRVALLDGKHRLRLNGGAEEVGILGHVTEIAVFRHDGELLVDLILTVEELILIVGGEEAADEGEDEHEDEDAQTHDREAVAEKALGNERAGGQDLNAAVVIEGVMIFIAAGRGAVLLGVLVLIVFRRALGGVLRHTGSVKRLLVILVFIVIKNAHDLFPLS